MSGSALRGVKCWRFVGEVGSGEVGSGEIGSGEIGSGAVESDATINDALLLLCLKSVGRFRES